MATDTPNEANPVEPGGAAESGAGPSRRDLLVQGGRVVAGIGVAALLGNLGNWALSYAGYDPTSLDQQVTPRRTSLALTSTTRSNRVCLSR